MLIVFGRKPTRKPPLLGSLRRRVRIAPMLPSETVDLIVIESIGHGLRDVLESFGARVNYTPVGQARDVVELLNGTRTLSRLVVLECHGDERGMVLPELNPALEATQPYHGAISAANYQEFLR